MNYIIYNVLDTHSLIFDDTSSYFLKHIKITINISVISLKIYMKV